MMYGNLIVTTKRTLEDWCYLQITSFIYGLYDRKAFYKVKNCFFYCFFNFLQAYKEWERINGKEQQLPGIPLNVDQLFFVSMGQVRYFKKSN